MIRPTTRTFVDADGVQSIDFNHEVVAEEYEADDWEEVNENESQDGGQQDGSTVLSHRPDHIQQRLFSIDDIKQLAHSNSNSSVSECVGFNVPVDT